MSQTLFYKLFVSPSQTWLTIWEEIKEVFFCFVTGLQYLRRIFGYLTFITSGFLLKTRVLPYSNGPNLTFKPTNPRKEDA